MIFLKLCALYNILINLGLVLFSTSEGQNPWGLILFRLFNILGIMSNFYILTIL
jgi:hypothetical protein